MIIRNKKDGSYTALNNRALNDPRLSLKAKGLWAFIMTKPDTWKVTCRGLESQLRESKDTIAAVMRELHEAGYLDYGQVRSKEGKFRTSETIVYETPCPKKPDTEKPDPDSSDVLVNTNKVNTEQVITTSVVVDKTSSDKKLLETLNEMTGRNFRVLPEGYKKTLSAFSLEEIQLAWSRLIVDEWHKPRLERLSSSYLIRATTIDRFLSKKESGAERGYSWD